MTDLRHFIGGEFVDPATREWIDDVAPATNETVARIARGADADVDAAVTAAEEALAGAWGKSTVNERAELCEEVSAAIERRADDLAEMECLDTGKPITLARNVDIPRAVLNFRFFAGQVRHAPSEFHEMPGAINYTLRRPVGIVGLITPWNLPIYLLSWKAAPALASGNCVVAKPSELTPLTAHALAEIIRDAGVPEGVFNLVQGYGAEAGQALVEHPDVRAISFTGGTATGRRVAQAAAQTFKKVSLELGGKNPSIVFADCDFEKTVEGVTRAGFLNQGQVCLCGSRVLVEEGLFDEFAGALTQRVESLRLGDPRDVETDLGALISQDHRDKVEGYIRLAGEEGGRFLTGGGRPDLEGDLANGAFVQPCVVANLSSSCRTATEEIFGPVVTLHSFADETQAVAMANEVKYGLSASVWTHSLDRAHRVSAALDTGMVWVNTWLLRDLRVPFGGVKDSGVGREGGKYSLEFFSETKNVCIQVEPRSP